MPKRPHQPLPRAIKARARSKDRRRPESTPRRKRVAVSGKPSASRPLHGELETVGNLAKELARDARRLVLEHGSGDWRPFVAQAADLLERLTRAIRKGGR